ncbi:type III secretion system chaperone family protein [Phaeovulum vinaykumarii]|uniref:Diacylglyceryl transferase n=1 Tax=Phaeovulum vinaykumarii TaxID=407234 RepID=A0A1N7L752_9RHOB|nr:YbjN domain-containing protein [Phaeovulum vinaykumarii]SIS69702.1 hypothetical protein SAMN05421795_102645 [Phaeovulum vinaykumarii]SOB99359.1 hypothetical protein SAMN05878426_102127 [Phaeovulum vinaykumarii]
MALSEDYLHEDRHPIDVAESLAERHDWDFDRVTDDQIALVVEGQWRGYSINLAWSDADETLRVILTFEMEPPADRRTEFLDLLNRVNDEMWTGAFTYWPEQRMMVWRYGLVLAGGQPAGFEQIDRMVGAGVAAAERFYPALQLCAWGGETPEEALRVAIRDAYGRA